MLRWIPEVNTMGVMGPSSASRCRHHAMPAAMDSIKPHFLRAAGGVDVFVPLLLRRALVPLWTLRLVARACFAAGVDAAGLAWAWGAAEAVPSARARDETPMVSSAANTIARDRFMAISLGWGCGYLPPLETKTAGLPVTLTPPRKQIVAATVNRRGAMAYSRGSVPASVPPWRGP